MITSRERFIDLMKTDILKLDLADLDFGIYRILNHRRDEIEEFFDVELPAVLDQAMAGTSDDDDVFAESEEDHLYNALYTFFSRYYRDGDFQPQQRRANDARFSVPYNGEDVHFHWRSKGSHYIKTTEELKSYSFRSGGWKVRFELVEAFQEPDNVKGTSRYFVPVPEEARGEVGDEGNLFIVPFVFRKLTVVEDKRYGKKSKTLDGDSTQERLINDLGDGIDPPDGVGKEDLLRHMQRYARRNRTDYFVHPRLGEFLRGELDFFLKNEFLDIEALTSTDAVADRLTKMRATGEVANQIIDMLDEIELFQARLFEKRKFVLSNSYLVPIRSVPEELWDEVLSSKDQVDQWRREFGIKGRIGRQTLSSHPTLVADTSLLPGSFMGRLLSSLDDISEMTDGVLINSENSGALRTIGPTFRGHVSLIYIDPPYNTGSDGFLYKDDFARHSAWLSMIEERVALGFSLLSGDGCFVSSIGDDEVVNLTLACDAVAGSQNHLATMIWNNEGNIDNQSRIKGNHEYLLLYAKDNPLFQAPHVIDPDIPEDSKLYNDTIANSITKNGPANPPSAVVLPVGFPATFEEGIVEPGASTWPKLSGAVEVQRSQLLAEVTATSGWSSRALLDEFIANDCDPIRDRKGTLTWFAMTPSGAIYGYKERPDNQSHVLTVIRNVGTTKQMSGVLERMGFDFTYPKPEGLLAYVARWHNDPAGWHLDYFAGSGTSARAVIASNREQGARRRFVAIEMAEYFGSILKPHIAKVMYAPDWERKKPKPEPEFHGATPEWVEHSPRLVQLLTLESYEDSLNSLVVEVDDQLASEHRIRYAIPTSVEESPVLLATDRLGDPFDYQLEIHTDEGLEFRDVDLVTTFNLIKGIRPKRYRELDDAGRRYVVIEGDDCGDSVLVVWRSVKDLDPQAERSFLDEAIAEALGAELADYDTIWNNADSAIPNALSLDAEFKRLMFEPESALS